MKFHEEIILLNFLFKTRIKNSILSILILEMELYTLLKSTGIIRRIDELGRIVIPKEIRRNLGIRDGENIEIFMENESIILKKYNRLESTQELATKLCNLIYNTFNYSIIITDREKVLSSSGMPEFINNLKINSEYLNIMENREIIIKENYEINVDNETLNGNFIFIPIISLNDSIGLVIMYNKEKLTNELALGKLISSIFNEKLDI